LCNLDGTQQEKRKNLFASLSLSGKPKKVTKLDLTPFCFSYDPKSADFMTPIKFVTPGRADERKLPFGRP
jgi:hypothetical protein